MLLSKNAGWSVVLSLSLTAGSSLLAFADDELPPPPPPEAALPAIEDAASAGAELPPPPAPEAPPEVIPNPPATTATAPAAPPAEAPAEVPNPADLSEAPPPPPSDELAAPNEAPADVPSGDTLMPEAPPEIVQAPTPPQMSTKAEFADLSAGDKLKQNDLVLWLSLGGAYGQIDTKGSYRQASATSQGGVGYSANFGIMATKAFQVQFDFTGLPRTQNSTVDNAMLGFGPRLGFLSVMGLLGVTAADALVTTVNGTATVNTDNPPRVGLFSYGVKGSLDLVLSHSDNSRVSYGIAPEAFWITTQGDNGYTNMGVSVSLRIYGYENAF